MQLASKLVLSRIQQPLLTNTARELARAHEQLFDAQRNNDPTLKYVCNTGMVLVSGNGEFFFFTAYLHQCTAPLYI